MFVVTGAKSPGDPKADVKSWGKKDNGKMGRVDAKTTNPDSKGTNATDKADWQSVGQKGSNTTCTPIPATDATVDKSASSVMENKDYAKVPLTNSEANSNSAAQAVANDAAGEAVPAPGNRIPVGAGNADAVDFDKDGDGKADPKPAKEPKKKP